MSAIAGFGGLVLWFLILSIPLIIYLTVSFFRARREKPEQRWVESRPADEQQLESGLQYKDSPESKREKKSA
jgi:hypothetical protein